jgi:hypothetical protein
MSLRPSLMSGWSMPRTTWLSTKRLWRSFWRTSTPAELDASVWLLIALVVGVAGILLLVLT